MTSRNVLKALSKNLTDYFTTNRKESCFDSSGPNLPICHYPIRFHRTLIDYQQDLSKSVKHYFSSLDLRKRLTCFHAERLDAERYKAILTKLKNYIRLINNQRYTQKLFERERKPPWNQFWWKSRGQTFRAIYLMSRYESQIKRHPHASSFDFSYVLKRKKPKIKRKYISGKPPVLRMCPHPYISRGEAERIINHAARLLLITETFEPYAYEYTAPGMKIKYLHPAVPDISKKLTKEKETYNKARATKTKTKSKEVKICEVKETEISGTKTPTFKIKKNTSLQQEDSETAELSKSLDFQQSDIFTKGIEVNALHISEESKKKEESFGNTLFKKSPDNTESESIVVAPKETSRKISVGCFPGCKPKANPVIEACDDRKDIFKIQPMQSLQPGSTLLSTEVPTNTTLESSKLTLHTSSKNTSSESHDSMDKIKPPQPKPNALQTVGTWLKSQTSHEDTHDKNENCQFQTSNNKVEIVKQKNYNFQNMHRFEIKVVTGDRTGASTNAKIWLYIVGDQNTLKKSVELKKSMTNVKPFRRANTDVFKLKSTRFLGKIVSIQIGHDSDEPGSDWFLESVSIKDCDFNLNYFFPCWRWLSVRSEDKQSRINLQYNPVFHEPVIQNRMKTENTDVSIQCNCIEDDDNIKLSTFRDKKSSLDEKIDHKFKSQESLLSDLVVEFSNLSSSDLTATSQMSMRHGSKDQQIGFIDGNYYYGFEHSSTAEILVMENSGQNSPRSTSRHSHAYQQDTDNDCNCLHDRPSSCSPNPVSFGGPKVSTSEKDL